MKNPHTLPYVSLAVLGLSCAGAAQQPPASAPNASSPPAELWCGPITCPAWLALEPVATNLSLRERCSLLSDVLTFQPLSLVGRPLSAFETSQRNGVGRIDKRLAALVTVREDAQTRGQSWFAAGETCGAGILVLAPSATHGEYDDANSFFRLALTPLAAGKVGAFDFELTAEPLSAQVSTADFSPLRGRVERGQSAGPDTWKVIVHAEVNSADALKD